MHTLQLQHTLPSPLRASGVGLHGGHRVRVTLRPAPPDHGVVFVRADLPGAPRIPAHVEHLHETRLATTLGVGGATVATVEHLLAALVGMGIDNVVVEVAGPELPIFDGSAQPWVERVRRAGGPVAQGRPRRALVVLRPIEVRDGDKLARLEPAPRFEAHCTIAFAHPLIGRQRRTYAGAFEELAAARTFGFGRDVDALHAQGLARGGGVDNAVVFDEDQVRNPGGLRFPDEPVRHKILDAIGDLALLGGPLIGRYVGIKSGHQLNTRLVAALLADHTTHAWEAGEPERAAS